MPTALQKDAIEILATKPIISKRQAMIKVGYSQLFIGIRRQAGGTIIALPENQMVPSGSFVKASQNTWHWQTHKGSFSVDWVSLQIQG